MKTEILYFASNGWYFKDVALRIKHHPNAPARRWYTGCVEYFVDDWQHNAKGPALGNLDNKFRHWAIQELDLLRT